MEHLATDQINLDNYKKPFITSEGHLVNLLPSQIYNLSRGLHAHVNGLLVSISPANKFNMTAPCGKVTL